MNGKKEGSRSLLIRPRPLRSSLALNIKVSRKGAKLAKKKNKKFLVFSAQDLIGNRLMEPLTDEP